MTADELKIKLGQNIAKYRKLRGLTQRELAIDAGSSKEMIGKFERGQIERLSFVFLANISQALKVSVSHLFR